MIGRPTVLVLGAGASAPYGLPTGRQLLMQVVHHLGNQGSILDRILKQSGFPELQIAAFRDDLARSMQPSIDAFLENRPEFLELGKIAIAASLIPYESEDGLQRRLPEPEKWYEYLFNRLGPTLELYKASKLSVLTFNYDRSFEHFLFLALRHSFGLPKLEDDVSLWRRVPVVHLYGQLGPLNYDSREGGRPYNPELSAAIARAAAKGIRIFHEGTVDDDAFDRARALMEGAEVVCFLGFGYHPRNVQRLAINTLSEKVRIYGSVFGLMGAEVDGIRALFNRQVQFGNHSQDVLLFLRNNPVL